MTVDGVEIARIGPGLVAFVGVGIDDREVDARALAAKTAALRIFGGAGRGKERSVVDVAGDVLVVSQFTLMGDARRGNRPSWSGAAPPDRAEPLVHTYAEALRESVPRVAVGRFGADMAVTLTNDGPVTILLERATGGGPAVA